MKIKKLRQTRGITQKDFAEKLGVDRSTVSYWESGAVMPRAELLPRIADALNCTIDALFGRDTAASA